MTAAPLPARLAEIEAALAKGTADGEWRAVDNGTRHGPENRYEILDDEGSVAVCSDDNDATATTGADRTALIVAAVNALPELLATVREQADAIDAVQALHVSDGAETPFCNECGHTYPCHTLRALLPAEHATDEEKQ